MSHHATARWLGEKVSMRLVHAASDALCSFLHRHAGVLEMSVYSLIRKPDDSEATCCCCFAKVGDTEGLAVYMSHDLSLLRLIETFAEGAPQLVLMLTLLLQQGQLNPITGAVCYIS